MGRVRNLLGREIFAGLWWDGMVVMVIVTVLCGMGIFEGGL